jgi:diphthamide synthase (EF-2-diphthine--ammonia ligase)
MKIKECKKCGFILNTRPNLKDNDCVCSACFNQEKKKDINFIERQEWLTTYIKENKTHEKYDCLVAVSGGKDSTTIVRKLFESHGIKKILLVHITDEFTHTKAGIHNLNNIIKRYNCDLITFRVNPNELAESMRNGLTEFLNPLKWLEEQIYQIPIGIATNYGIKLVFYGENPEFEYGSNEKLEIFHHASTDSLRIIYLGAIYPYSTQDWFACAKEVGFLDLNHYNEWQRQGHIENYSQIDSIGYSMGIWTKFPKFGFQRVSDIASRLVRDGHLTRQQAKKLIEEHDYICDPTSKRDFCRAIKITEIYFDEMVDKHANKNIVEKDINGTWRRKDLM